MASLDFDKEEQAFREYWDANHELWNEAKNSFVHIINRLLRDKKYNLSIHGRVKDKEGAIKKFDRKYRKQLEDNEIEYEIKDHITDMIGLRIICLYEPDIEDIKNILIEDFEVLEVTNKTKDMEAKVNSFGYKGLHLDLKLKGKRHELSEYKPYADMQFEVQIRTIIQDAWSTLDHKIKYKQYVAPFIQRRVNALAALFEIADKEFYAIHEEVNKDKQKMESVKDTEQLNVFKFNNLIKEIYNKSNLPLRKEDISDDKINAVVNNDPLLKNINIENLKDKIFYHYELDLFDDLLKENNVTVNEFMKYLSDWYVCVDKFNNYLKNTGVIKKDLPTSKKVLYVLYKGDKDKFSKYLTKEEKNKFDFWYKKQTDAE